MANELDLSEEFQLSLVHKMCADSDWTATHRPFLKSEYALVPGLSVLIQEIHAFYDRYATTPELSVLADVIGRKAKGPVLGELLALIKRVGESDVSESRIAYIQERIRDFATASEYRARLIDAAQALNADDLAGVRRAMENAVAFGTLGLDDSLMLFDEKSIRSRVARTAEDDARERVPTLIPSLDKKLRGGSDRRCLHIVLAPPSRGKSMGLVNIGANALYAGANVLHVTNEMSARKVAARYEMKLSGMTYDQISSGMPAFIAKMRQFRSLYKGNLNIKEYPARGATVLDLETHIRSLARKGFQTTLLVVDYVDELKRPARDNESYAIGDVVAALRALATKFDIPVWTATQTQRGSLNKARLDMDDVADSWEKAKIADVMVAMCQTEKELADSIMRWYLIKNRDNAPYTKPIYMRTNFKIASFKEVHVEV